MTNLETLTGQMAGPRFRFGERWATEESFDIYAAMQSTLTRPVLIRIARESGDEAKAQMIEIAQRIAKCDRLPIARTIEVGTVRRRPFLALEAGGAEPISAWSTRPGASAELMGSWAVSMLSLFHQIHGAGLRIEDPERHLWLLGADGRVWLADAEAIRTEGPRVNATQVVKVVLEPLAASSPEATAALDAALAEVPKPAAPPAPLQSAAARLRARMNEEWRVTPTRSLVLGGLGLAVAGSALFLASSTSVPSTRIPEARSGVHYVLPRIHVTAIDPELTLARASAERSEKYAALKSYRVVAQRDVESIGDEDLTTLVSYLDLSNEGTRSAEQSLLLVGRRAEPALRSAFADLTSSNYHRRRAGEVLRRLGLKVDLVPLWIQALESPRCSARRLAAFQLAKSNDRRALAPLEALADKDGWFSSYCGAEAAEAALDRLSDRLDRY